MQLEFYKYQGAGNDFVIVNDLKGQFKRDDNELVRFLCDRRFGIGGDGLMLLRSSKDYDFEMVYYNSDGYEGSMCGNGGRCIVAFAYHQGIVDKECSFIATDGAHAASVIDKDGEEWVSLKMIDVTEISTEGQGVFLDTGSPHYVEFVKNLKEFPVVERGREIRNSGRFIENGTNVNFAEVLSNGDVKVRTYERGVEDETLACGTGVTAVTIAADYMNMINNNRINIRAVGGDLCVLYTENDQVYSDVWLQGPAKFVFKGCVDV